MRKMKIKRKDLVRINGVRYVLDQLRDSVPNDKSDEFANLHTCIAMLCSVNNIAHKKDRKWQAALTTVLCEGNFFSRWYDGSWKLVKNNCSDDIRYLIKRNKITYRDVRRHKKRFIWVFTEITDVYIPVKSVLLEVPYYYTMERESLKRRIGL